jgi:hypothetical protein
MSLRRPLRPAFPSSSTGVVGAIHPSSRAICDPQGSGSVQLHLGAKYSTVARVHMSENPFICLLASDAPIQVNSRVSSAGQHRVDGKVAGIPSPAMNQQIIQGGDLLSGRVQTDFPVEPRASRGCDRKQQRMICPGKGPEGGYKGKPHSGHLSTGRASKGSLRNRHTRSATWQESSSTCTPPFIRWLS